MKRTAQAVWRGAGKDGQGQVTTGSGALRDQPYSTFSRFESEDGKAGTNPEELIAAAHASCFSMATAYQLSGAGHVPEELRTDAELTLEKLEAGQTITSIHLVLRAKVAGITDAQFQELATKAQEGCPISRLLNTTITLDARLV